MREGGRHDSIGPTAIVVAPRSDANLARDRLNVASNTAGRTAERASRLGIVERDRRSAFPRVPLHAALVTARRTTNY